MNDKQRPETITLLVFKDRKKIYKKILYPNVNDKNEHFFRDYTSSSSKAGET